MARQQVSTSVSDQASQKFTPVSRKGFRPLHTLSVGGAFVALTALAAVFMFPLYWVVVASFKSASELRRIPPTWWPQVFTFANYAEVWSGTMARYFLNSFVYAGASTAIVLITSSAIAYVLVKDPSRVGNMIFWVILSTSMVPFVTYLLPLFKLLVTLQNLTGIPWVNTYWGMILPGVVSPFGVFLMRQSMLSVPSELLDAARIDGSSEMGIYWRIAVPLVRHSLAALAIIMFLFKYDDLLWPLVVAQRTDMYPITIGLVEYVGTYFTEYNLFTTAAVLAVIPVLALYIILQRQIVEGVATQGLKG